MHIHANFHVTIFQGFRENLGERWKFSIKFHGSWCPLNCGQSILFWDFPARARRQALYQRNFLKIWALYHSPIPNKVCLNIRTYFPTPCEKALFFTIFFIWMSPLILYIIFAIFRKYVVFAPKIHPGSFLEWGTILVEVVFMQLEKMHFFIKHSTMDISSMVRRRNLILCRNNFPYAAVYV